MMKKLFLFLFVYGLLVTVRAGLPQKINLGGQWEFRRTGTSTWYPAIVPGCVQLDLLKNNLINDPFYRSNEDSVQWIAGCDWEYRRFFNIDETAFASGQIALFFEGLDTYASVYLNDSLVVTANNMFREWQYENAKPKLHKGKNELRILFHSIIRQNKELYDKLPYKLPGDEKTVCRKAAYNFGWDWGPVQITMGIWKPVYLRLYKQVNLTGVHFIQRKLTDSAAYLTGVFTLNSTQPGKVRITIKNEKLLLVSSASPVNKGTNKIRIDFVIKNPKLWWPNGLGLPNLYSLNYNVYSGNELIDNGLQKIGLRTIELIQQPDSAGKTFYFLVNKIPVFMKGANYIPQDNFPSRVSDSAYQALITEVKDLNMNMLRVWGGGIYEKDLFYDLCDEAGILIWQDFMFACAMYPGNQEFLENVNEESIQNISRLRRHPCIALWCGNNEISEGWHNWGWTRLYNKPGDSAMVYKGYNDLFNTMLKENVERYDTLRPYVPSSPMFGWGDPKSKGAGDMHYWGVWWGKEPFTKYREIIGRFMSEYGFQAFPDLSSINKFSKPGDRQLGSVVMKAHQKHPTGYELIDEYLLREYKRPKDFESYIFISQLLQAGGIRTAVEAHRRAMPHCMGTLIWQLNDCWPVISWSARDYYGTPKALQYVLQNEFRDVLVSPVIEHGRIRIYIISDRTSPINGNLKINVTDFYGKVLRDTIRQINLPKLSSAIYFDVDSSIYLNGMNLKNILLSARFSAEDKNHNSYSNTLYFVPVKDLSLERPNITRTIKKITGGYKITLKTDKLAKNVWFSTDIKGTFSDNFMDIIPGKPGEVIYSTTYDQKDLSDKISIHSVQDTY